MGRDRRRCPHPRTRRSLRRESRPHRRASPTLPRRRPSRNPASAARTTPNPTHRCPSPRHRCSYPTGATPQAANPNQIVPRNSSSLIGRSAPRGDLVLGPRWPRRRFRDTIQEGPAPTPNPSNTRKKTTGLKIFFTATLKVYLRPQLQKQSLDTPEHPRVVRNERRAMGKGRRGNQQIVRPDYATGAASSRPGLARSRRRTGNRRE